MKESTSSSRDVRFGLFEVDLQAGELRKNGHKIKLQEQPFRVLSLLLERAGEVVTGKSSVRSSGRQTRSLTLSIASTNPSKNCDRRWETRLTILASLRRWRAEAIGSLRRWSKWASAFQTPTRRWTRSRTIQCPRPPLLSCRKWKRTRARRWTAGWTWVAVLTALILAGAGWFYFHRSASLPPMKVVRFTSYPGKEKDPALSPDGKRLAFVWDGESGDNFDIYVRSIGPVGELPMTTEKPLRLTTDPAPDLSPTWSPDGRYLAFARVSEGNSAVYVMPSMGGQERN